MNIGVICGDRWHAADVVIEGLSPLDSGSDPGGFHFDYITDTLAWSNDTLKARDIVVLAKGNARSPVDWDPWLTEDVQQAFVDFVERGGGLLVIHSGTTGYSAEPLFRRLIGGGFVHHPHACPVTVTSEDNAVIPAIGAQTFTAHDEHYFMELYGDDLNHFMTSTSEHGTQPAGWTRQQGQGRVCVLTPGHFGPVWQDPTYRQMIAVALDWCAKGRR